MSTSSPNPEPADARPSTPIEPPAKPAKSPLTTAQKWRQFWIGFGAWWLINSLIWFPLSGADNLGYGIFFSLLVLPLNLIVLLVLAFIRRWMALGVLTTYGVNLLVSVLYRPFDMNGICWVPFYAGGR